MKAGSSDARATHVHLPGHAPWLFCVLLLALAGSSSAVRAAIYYVNGTTGNDLAPETSPGTAWKSIQKAANTMVAGDTVRIKAGVDPESVTPQNSGEPGTPSTYRSHGDGAVVIRPTRFPFHLPACRRLEYLRFVGLTLAAAQDQPRECGETGKERGWP